MALQNIEVHPEVVQIEIFKKNDSDWLKMIEEDGQWLDPDEVFVILNQVAVGLVLSNTLLA
jgi:hypothetical protein